VAVMPRIQRQGVCLAVVILVALARAADAQTSVTYHLHNEASSVSGVLRLLTNNPDTSFQTHPMDYFGARYYQSQTGRFTTVDPGHVGGDLLAPQSWNGYAYANNNPLRFLDPSGLYVCAATMTVAECDRFEKARADAESGAKKSRNPAAQEAVAVYGTSSPWRKSRLR
jgi:RHS repeat-associated protein